MFGQLYSTLSSPLSGGEVKNSSRLSNQLFLLSSGISSYKQLSVIKSFDTEFLSVFCWIIICQQNAFQQVDRPVLTSPSQHCMCTLSENDFRGNFLIDLWLLIINYQQAQQDAAFQSSGDKYCHPGAQFCTTSEKLISDGAFLQCWCECTVYSVHKYCVCTPSSLSWPGLNNICLSRALMITSQSLWTFWTPAWDFQFQHPEGSGHRPVRERSISFTSAYLLF